MIMSYILLFQVVASFDAFVYFFRLFYQLYRVFDERIFLLDGVAEKQMKVETIQNGLNHYGPL